MSAPTNRQAYGFTLKPGQKIVGMTRHLDGERKLLFRQHHVRPGDNGRSEGSYYDHPDGHGGWKEGRGPRYYSLVAASSNGPAATGDSPNSVNSSSTVDKRAFDLVHIGDLKHRPPEYLIEGLLETDSLGMMFGPPAAAKSFVAVDIALCVASGTPFHGRSVKQGPVIYVAGEGHNGLARRIRAWSVHHGVPLEHAPCFISTCATSLVDEKIAKVLFDAVQKIADKHGTPGLIILDTLARNFGTGDENNTAEMGHCVSVLDRLRVRHSGSTILIVHHSGHSDQYRARGAIALKGALDAEYRVEKVEDLVTIENTKMKDAPRPLPIAFRLENVDTGKNTSSAVLIETEAPAQAKKSSPAQRLALKTYVAAAIECAVWSNGVFAGVHLREWRKQFNAQHPADNPDTKRQAFNRVRRELCEAQTISVVNDIYLWNDDTVIQEIKAEREKRSRRKNRP